VTLARALELAERGRGTTHPNPVVGAVVVRDGEVIGEGWHERKGGPHGEVVALEAAGERARGATLYVTMEPCTHHGSTPPCTKAILDAGVARVVTGAFDPNPEAGGGLEELRVAGVDVELIDSFEARAQNEAWRTWVSQGRPFVTYKAAMTLDGRLTLPGERWISGEESRRLVHELRAASDAVAVGMGTVTADAPKLTARASEGMQSLLLEGGPTLAAGFFRDDLIDKLLVFTAPTVSGEGPTLFEGGVPPRLLTRLQARPVGEDILLSAYVHEP
jgi:diaminohydroxyphosphoribosylaminopyrimidine deaminase / 5-amino-6-(5-phosphoribosylamino)uracil reductase